MNTRSMVWFWFTPLSPISNFAAGRFTILDHYTFTWPDGRMALALGLGIEIIVTLFLSFRLSLLRQSRFALQPLRDTQRFLLCRPFI